MTEDVAKAAELLDVARSGEGERPDRGAQSLMWMA